MVSLGLRKRRRVCLFGRLALYIVQGDEKKQHKLYLYEELNIVDIIYIFFTLFIFAP